MNSPNTNGTAAAANAVATPIMAAMNMNPAMSGLATLMTNQTSMDMSQMPAAAAALSNAFGIGNMGALNAASNQFAAGNVAATMQNPAGVGLAGIGSAQGGGLGMIGSAGGSLGAAMSGANIGTAAGGQAQPSPFQS